MVKSLQIIDKADEHADLLLIFYFKQICSLAPYGIKELMELIHLESKFLHSILLCSKVLLLRALRVMTSPL